MKSTNIPEIFSDIDKLTKDKVNYSMVSTQTLRIMKEQIEDNDSYMTKCDLLECEIEELEKQIKEK